MGSDKISMGITGIIILSGFLILSHEFLCESAFILSACVCTLVTGNRKQPLLLPLIVDHVDVLIALCAIVFDCLQPLDLSLTLGLSV